MLLCLDVSSTRTFEAGANLFSYPVAFWDNFFEVITWSANVLNPVPIDFQANILITTPTLPYLAVNVYKRIVLNFYQDLNWNGLQEESLFKRPKATALISVSGVPAGRLNVKNPVARYQTAEV